MSKTLTTCECTEMGLTESAGGYYPVPEDKIEWIKSFDIIVVNTSAGKDSQVQLDVVCKLAEQAGVLDRVVAIHCDLGQVEWAGVPELAEKQAKFYGVRFVKVSRDRDLLHQIEFERKDFPGKSARFCTSDQKTAQVMKAITKLVAELHLGRQARVLSCLGLRSQESAERRNCTCCKNKGSERDWKKGVRRPKNWVPRSECPVCQGSGKRQPLEHDFRHSSGVRWIDEWLPILSWTKDEVWARIHESGVPHHFAYDLGMPRLSCCLCPFAGKASLVLAARHNLALAKEYARIEAKVGHKFSYEATMAEVVALAEQGAEVVAEDWED